MAETEHCPVCGTPLSQPQSNYGDKAYFHCPRCGLFGLTGTAEALLPGLIKGNRRSASVLSYAIKNTSRKGPDTPLFNEVLCKKIIDIGMLPTPHEQADRLVRWLGDNLAGPGELVPLRFDHHGPIIGAQSKEGLRFVVDGLTSAGLIGRDERENYVTLSFEGWRRFDELRRGTPTGRTAFMAMKYQNATLDKIVNEYFRPAVAETGFFLKRLDDEPKAGLIDDRLRVEIQASRFLIVDLTHKNAGAYWEAGYAEGLGKPVIYTCEASKFRAASHFDTNHHLHVLWNKNDLIAVAKQLKATVRATIPEAKPEG